MNRAIIHIEVDDCLSECPFAQYICKDGAYCNKETCHIDRFPDKSGATPVPEWCPFLVK